MNGTQFSTFEEEIEHLRGKLAEKMEKSKGFEDHFTPKDHAREAIRDYQAQPIEKTIAPHSHMTEGETHRLLKDLKPKHTDTQVEMLVHVMAEKGVKNALSVAEELKNPEVEDDFHRFLVNYILSGHDPRNDVSKEEWKALHMQLFEVVLPEVPDGQPKQLREMMALMEQWYASMQALASDGTNKEKNYYTLELSVSHGSTTASFYCAVHKDYAPLFEKVVLGVFPTAQVRECKDDYNIFHDHAITACSYASTSTDSILPIRTYETMEADPMSLILSSFTKIKKDNEGLALQVLVRPAGEFFAKKYGSMLDDLRKGETMKRVIEKQDTLKETFHIMSSMFSPPKKKDDTKDTTTHTDEVAMKLVQEKLSKTIIETNVRIIASAETIERVQAIRKDLESAFSQFVNV
ncbi:MAG: hypothetical protein QG653_586, partial [Patescibacteria group bacterium]|nr:hypothetical protein [Patescibacteria group bacterium]